MFRSVWIPMTLVAYTTLLSPAFGSDMGTPDILRLSETRRGQGEATVAVHVINDQRLSALDIPLRFGQPGDPIELTQVDFTERVDHWDVTHAQIDNQNKTVILGLIAVLGRMDQSADLEVANAENAVIAHLVFRVDDRYDLHSALL